MRKLTYLFSGKKLSPQKTPIEKRAKHPENYSRKDFQLSFHLYLNTIYKDGIPIKRNFTRGKAKEKGKNVVHGAAVRRIDKTSVTIFSLKPKNPTTRKTFK